MMLKIRGFSNLLWIFYPVMTGTFLLSMAAAASGQNRPKKSDDLNQMVQFSNESIHGLLIVHRLLELYNQDINKYVDLEGYQLNFYSNDDLPQNVFEDPDDWFYETSPNEWLQVISQNIDSSGAVDNRIFQLAKEMNNICIAINRIRFVVESYIQENDLTIRDKLDGVYVRLENAVKMYDDYFARQVQLENLIIEANESRAKQMEINSEFAGVYEDMTAVNTSFKQLLRALRSKDEIAFSSSLGLLIQKKGELQKSLASLPLNNAKARYSRNKIEDKLTRAIQSAKQFVQTAEVPREYQLYGKFYYYHNSDIINKMNRYGNGFTHEMNLILSELDLPLLYFFEEPHFYQVIYPEKITKDHAIESSDDQVELLPTTLKERKVVSRSHTMVVDESPFEIELFDHMIQDGDIISLNYNGDWILENYSLEAKPKRLRLKLNDEGKNYLLLHAETIGYRPPNTMGINYFFGGEKKQIILKSDLNTSEMILIEQQLAN